MSTTQLVNPRRRTNAQTYTKSCGSTLSAGIQSIGRNSCEAPPACVSRARQRACLVVRYQPMSSSQRQSDLNNEFGNFLYGSRWCLLTAKPIRNCSNVKALYAGCAAAAAATATASVSATAATATAPAAAIETPQPRLQPSSLPRALPPAPRIDGASMAQRIVTRLTTARRMCQAPMRDRRPHEAHGARGHGP